MAITAVAAYCRGGFYNSRNQRPAFVVILPLCSGKGHHDAKRRSSLLPDKTVVSAARRGGGYGFRQWHNACASFVPRAERVLSMLSKNCPTSAFCRHRAAVPSVP